MHARCVFARFPDWGQMQWTLSVCMVLMWSEEASWERATVACPDPC